MAQLERLPELISRKRKIFKLVLLASSRTLRRATLNSQTADVFNTYWMATAVLQAESTVADEGESYPHHARTRHQLQQLFHPLSMLPALVALRPERAAFD